MQEAIREQPQQPVGILFDCDLGDSIDGALALAMLHGLEGKNEARLAAVSVSKANLKAAAFCDIVERFYATGGGGAPGPFMRVGAVGLADDGMLPADTPLLTGLLSRTTPEGKPVYPASIKNLNDTAEVGAFIRNTLTAQQDGNAIMVMAGPANNLARLLGVHGASEVIAAKVRLLCVSAGAYPDGPPDANIKADIQAARRLFAEWPTDIVAVGSEVGAALPFPGSSVESGFAWSTAHPVADAYRTAGPMPYDAPSGAMAAALYAVRPQEGYFKLSERGEIRGLDDGRTRFTPAAEGRRRYLIADPGQRDRIIQAYVELASAKPVVRQRRFRPPLKKQDSPAATPKQL